MAKKAATSVQHKEPIKKLTSVGHGKRKLGSFKTNGQKRYRGQGKG